MARLLRLLLALCAAALVAGLLVACAPGAESAAAEPTPTRPLPSLQPAPTDAPFICPVTLPPETPFVPPTPWPAVPPDPGRYWFGDSDLWTALPLDGQWAQLARGEKFWWWSANFDVQQDDTPDLLLTARRLDGDAPPFQSFPATNGYHDSINWAMLAGVTLPTPGCWEITGHYQGTQQTIVVNVPAQ